MIRIREVNVGPISGDNCSEGIRVQKDIKDKILYVNKLNCALYNM